MTELPRYIMDSGVIVGESKGDSKVRALVRAILKEDAALLVPAIVVTETYRGNATDVHLNRLLDKVRVEPADEALAKVAGSLLAKTGKSNAPDAQVVATALRRAPCTILTSDPADIGELVGDYQDIDIIDVGRL